MKSVSCNFYSKSSTRSMIVVLVCLKKQNVYRIGTCVLGLEIDSSVKY